MYYVTLICGLRIFNPGWKNLTLHVLSIVSFRHAQLLAVQIVQSLAVHHVHLREPTVRHHSLHVTLPLVLCNSHRVNCGRHCVCWMIVNGVLERWRNHRMFFGHTRKKFSAHINERVCEYAVEIKQVAQTY